MYRDHLHPDAKIVHHGFLIDVEAEEGTSVSEMQDHLAGACTWLEGVGRTDVEYMGEIPDEPSPET